jgi:hypothetical protein
MVHKSIRVSAILSVLLLGATSAVGADQAPAMPISGSSDFSTTPIPTDTIATVNGVSIPISAVEATVMRDPGVVDPIIDKLVNDYLISQEALKQHLSATNDEIEGRKEELMALNRVSDLTNLLSRHHETMTDLEHDITMWIDTMKLLTPNAPVPVIVQIKSIFIHVATAAPAAPQSPYAPHTDAQALRIARGLQARLAKGESFDELVKEFSEDPSAQNAGGDLAFAYANGPLDPGVVKAAAALKAPGDTSPAPIKAPLGYYLIQLVSSADEHPASLNAAYSNIAIEIRSHSVTPSQVSDLITSLRKKAVIVDYYSGQ